jgi:hypothetical protein
MQQGTQIIKLRNSNTGSHGHSDKEKEEEKKKSASMHAQHTHSQTVFPFFSTCVCLSLVYDKTKGWAPTSCDHLYMVKEKRRFLRTICLNVEKDWAPQRHHSPTHRVWIDKLNEQALFFPLETTSLNPSVVTSQPSHAEPTHKHITCMARKFEKNKHACM